MPEILRYAWGSSSLGDFLVATTNRGIVAVEFSTARAAMENALRLRFPNAQHERDQEGLAITVEAVARLIDQPTSNCVLPLDLQGTPYEIVVWTLLREIPLGATTSYGALATKLGTRDARAVTAAIANNPIAVIVPCHRVIKKDGSISGYKWSVAKKRALLALEMRVALH